MKKLCSLLLAGALLLCAALALAEAPVSLDALITEIDKEAKALAAYQFAMYGMNDVPEDQLAGFADRLLGDDDQARRLYDKVESDKVIAYVKDTVTLDKKKSTIEKMRQQSK